MKLLLTSAGIKNPSIRNAMLDLLGKPIEECDALAIPTASCAHQVGLSGGSMVMTPRIGEDFKQWDPPGGGDETLGVVGFSIFPHLARDGMPGNSMAEAEAWFAGMDVPAYAIDDDTAIVWVDGAVEVVSEGHWKLFT